MCHSTALLDTILFSSVAAPKKTLKDLKRPTYFAHILAPDTKQLFYAVLAVFMFIYPAFTLLLSCIKSRPICKIDE